MLPFGLKVAWFTLSFSGLLSCWAVLSMFARAVQSWWGPLLYCIACTIMQGVFCLGMIWRMDPIQMPRAFCIAQTLLIGFSTYLLAGICTNLSWATSLLILNPGKLQLATTRPLAWRNVYALFVVVFPALATAVQIGVLVPLDAIQPTNDLHCDASSPVWTRFLGYAGLPLLLAIPCFLVSLVLIFRAHKVHKAAMSHTKGRLHTRPILINKLQIRMRSSGTQQTSSQQRRHLQSERPASEHQRCGSGSVRILKEDEVDVVPGPRHATKVFISPLLPVSPCSAVTSSSADADYPFTMAPLPAILGGDVALCPTTKEFLTLPSKSPDKGSWPSKYGNNFEREEEEKELYWSSTTGRWIGSRVSRTQRGVEDAKGQSKYAESTRTDSQVPFRAGDLKSVGGIRGSVVPDDNEAGTLNRWQPSYLSDRSSRSMQTITVDISPAIWRVVLFQTAFSAVCVLASVSTAIDVVTQRPIPTPFGTQHVALLLVAWGPAIVFVRRSLAKPFTRWR